MLRNVATTVFWFASVNFFFTFCYSQKKLKANDVWWRKQSTLRLKDVTRHIHPPEMKKNTKITLVALGVVCSFEFLRIKRYFHFWLFYFIFDGPRAFHSAVGHV
jgi:hypothetical protein